MSIGTRNSDFHIAAAAITDCADVRPRKPRLPEGQSRLSRRYHEIRYVALMRNAVPAEAPFETIIGRRRRRFR